MRSMNYTGTIMVLQQTIGEIGQVINEPIVWLSNIPMAVEALSTSPSSSGTPVQRWKLTMRQEDYWFEVLNYSDKFHIHIAEFPEYLFRVDGFENYTLVKRFIEITCVRSLKD